MSVLVTAYSRWLGHGISLDACQQMNNENVAHVVHTHNEIVFHIEEKENYENFRKIDESGNHCIEGII